VKFVDEVTIEVASGRGGRGHVSFRREKFVPRGGPDGGDGGRGGNVIFKTSTRLHSLLDLKIKTKYRAPDGDPGMSQNRSGLDGEDLVILVPPGTLIKDTSGTLVRDLGPDDEFIFLEGGIGGRGNPFYKSSVNQAPGVAQKGMPGKEATIHLELKLLADVGIIGYPNAGKSTLISHVSAAKPKIADYPFTTLVPNLGVVRVSDEANFIIADMPGLIKGAHQGVGLGTRFLKHIERTKCFVHVVDVGGVSERDPVQDFRDINEELKLYDRAHRGHEDFSPLSRRKQIVALNKIDILPEEEVAKITTKFEKFNFEVIPISAATGKNLDKLVQRMGEMVFNGDEEEDYQKNVGKVKGQKVVSKNPVKKIASKKSKAKTSGKKGATQKGTAQKVAAKKGSSKKSSAKKRRT